MANKKFSQFDNTTSVAATDEAVGFRPGTPNVNKRWTWSSIVSFLQGILNITLLDRNSDNHVRVAGAGAGSSPAIFPAGSDTNIDLVLGGKGTGNVQIESDTDLDGNALNTGGGDILTSGGNIVVGVGDITLSSGTLSLGTGNLLMAGGSLTMTAGGGISIDGTTTLDGTGLFASIVSCGTLISGGGVGCDTVTANSGTITALTVTTLTVANITGLTGFIDISGELSANTLTPQDVLDAGTAQVNIKVDNNITADVSSVQGGGLLDSTVNIITTCANAGDAVTLPSVGGAFPITGRYVLIRNDGANSADVFPNTGAQINALGANNAYALAAGATAMFFSKGTAVTGDWYAFTL